MKFCGVNACRNLWNSRRDAIIRVYLNQARMPEFSDLLGWCAEKRLAYHIVTNEELRKITKSTHHEGICILASPPRMLTLEQLCSRLANRTGPVCVLLLERVGNPHNVGAILRVAAHFGAAAIVCCDPSDTPPTMSTALYRTAEGGAEHVAVVAARNAVKAVERLQRCALQTIATSSHAETSLHGASLPARCLLLLGSEADGLSERVMATARKTLAIPGTGWVESMNVACATSVLLNEYRRQHPLDVS